MTAGHRNRANSVLVRCNEAMQRVLKRVKKHGLPRWHTVAEMEQDRTATVMEIGIQAWEDHLRDIELLEKELRIVKYPGEVPT